MFGFPRAVWLLGFVSLATDAATEAIYPLLPFFLTRVLGAGAVSLGIVEGAAEAVNSALKIWSGRAADRTPRKRRLVLLGYSVSSLARPFIALATNWVQVFTVRVLDRIGKGVRGAPRDAMLATWTTPHTRGKIYGFHRAMDHTGAIVGPALASLFLYFYPERYRTLFGLTIIPGAIAIGLILLVPEKGGAGGDDVAQVFRPANDAGLTSRATGLTSRATGLTSRATGLTSRATGPTSRATGPTSRATHAPAPLPRTFTAFMLVLTLFTLGNSTDAFLLLKLTDVAGSAKFIPMMWAALHVVKAVVSVVGGSWSDRVGRRSIIATGWLVYAAVYAGFAVSTSLAALVAWFLTYGLYFGFAEGTEKALVADLAPPERRGWAFGIYNAVQGVGALAASVLFGVIWNGWGAGAAFGVGAALALAATALLFVAVPRPQPL